MEYLSLREKELVAIGAAMGSNCSSCIEHHIPVAKKAGLTDAQIKEAIEVANKVRNTPSEKVLQTANALIGNVDACAQGTACSCNC